MVAFMSAGSTTNPILNKNMPMNDQDGINPMYTEEMQIEDAQEPKVSANNLYQNTDFRFRFDLKDGEQAFGCPYPVTDHIAVEIAESLMPITDNTMACAKEGAREYVYASKGDFEKEMKNLKEILESYNYDTRKNYIGDIEGTRYIGMLKDGIDGPIPDQIDFTVIVYKDVFYQITSDFYDRNVYIY
jgi:hypothetical protein